MVRHYIAIILIVVAFSTAQAPAALTLNLDLTNITTKTPPIPKVMTLPPSETPTAPMPLRLKLTLTDGTQVIGVPSVKTLPVKTSYADMQIPLENIRTVTFSKDHADLVAVLTNGDRMTATPKLTTLQLNTIFGKINVESRHIITITILLGSSAGQWPRDGLWGYWPLNGDAKDASGNDHDGIIKGAKPTEGVRGQAYTFDGRASINLGNPDFPNEEYTIAGWIRTDRPARTEDFRNWIDKLDNPRGTGPFAIGIGDGRVVDGGEDGPHYVVWDGGNGVVNLYPGKVNLRDGQWHHYAVTYKKGSQKVFVDGTLVAENSYSGSLPTNSTPITIGGHNFGPYTHPWIGDVDEVFIYQRSLTDDEVQSLYRHGQPGK